MRQFSINKPILLILLFLTFTGIGKGQKLSENFIKGLSIKPHIGTLSYFGDLSVNDYNPISKLQYGSSFGGGVSFVKDFGNFGSFQAQIIGGSLRSYNTNSHKYFEGSLLEVNGTLRANFNELINPYYDKPFYTYGGIGLGFSAFRAIQRDSLTQKIESVVGYQPGTGDLQKAPREIGVGLPFYLGVGYKINEKLSLEADFGYRKMFSDRIDAIDRQTNDWYSYLSAGIRYDFDPITRSKPSIIPTDMPPSGHFVETFPLQEILVESIMPLSLKAGKTFEAKLIISKGDYIGNAHITLKLPYGFEALQTYSQYGFFNFANQELNILWDQMPSDSILIYNYHIRVKESVSGNHTISGNISYGEANHKSYNTFNNYVYVENPLEEELDSKFRDLLGEEAIGKEKQNESISNVQADEILSRINSRNTDVKEESAYKRESSQIISYTKGEGLEYKIQCGAFRDPDQASTHLIRKFNISETLTEEYHQGYYKYTIGSFKSYDEAARYRDRFIERTQHWSAYIVAYYNGTRLASLKEAKKYE